MEDFTKDLNFVLANTDKGYVLTTNKIGSKTLEDNATDFLQFYKYIDGTLINFGNNTLHKGRPGLIKKIFDNHLITCLLRDPLERTITGIVEELLVHDIKNYPGAYELASANPVLLWLTERYFFPNTTVNKGNEVHLAHAESHKMVQHIVENFMKQPIFRQQWEKWWTEVIPYTWDRLKVSIHVRKYNEPLYHFIQEGMIKNYTTCLVQDINFKHNNHHSNWMFKQPIRKTLDTITQDGSKFAKDFSSYIREEEKYFKHLRDAS